jgi:hypothetical protein
MANTLTVQTLEEGPRNVRLRVVGVLDTSNVAVTDLVDPASYNQGGTGPTPSTFRIDEIEYSISDALIVQLVWDATADVTFAALAGRGEMCFQDEGGLQNNAGAGKTGKIQILTTGWTVGTQAFTLELSLVKIGTSL